MYFGGSSAVELSDRDAIITLMTDKFDTYEEAAHFAKVFEKHCYGIVEIENNIVYGKTFAYIVNSYYSGKTGHFEFANWA